MKKYNALYFIKKFEAIPESKWTIGKFYNKGKCCALGHCGWRNGSSSWGEGIVLSDLFNNYGVFVSYVNDGDSKESKVMGKTPKERILNALYLINAMEECE